MDADDGKEDVQSILSFGARAIFENNVADEIRCEVSQTHHLHVTLITVPKTLHKMWIISLKSWKIRSQSLRWKPDSKEA